MIPIYCSYSGSNFQDSDLMFGSDPISLRIPDLMFMVPPVMANSAASQYSSSLLSLSSSG